MVKKVSEGVSGFDYHAPCTGLNIRVLESARESRGRTAVEVRVSHHTGTVDLSIDPSYYSDKGDSAVRSLASVFRDAAGFLETWADRQGTKTEDPDEVDSYDLELPSKFERGIIRLRTAGLRDGSTALLLERFKKGDDGELRKKPSSVLKAPWSVATELAAAIMRLAR